MIESNIYLEMILHTNLDLTGNTEENVGFFMDYKRKSQQAPAPCPIKAARRSKIIR